VISSANGKKFYELFDEEQRAYILKQLSQVKLDLLNTNYIWLCF